MLRLPTPGNVNIATPWSMHFRKYCRFWYTNVHTIFGVEGSIKNIWYAFKGNANFLLLFCEEYMYTSLFPALKWQQRGSYGSCSRATRRVGQVGEDSWGGPQLRLPNVLKAMSICSSLVCKLRYIIVATNFHSRTFYYVI